jgi:hypothetical protein
VGQLYFEGKAMQIEKAKKSILKNIHSVFGVKPVQVFRQRMRQHETGPLQALPKQTLSDLGVHRDGLSGKLTLVSRFRAD